MLSFFLLTRLEAGFSHFRVATLCLILQPWVTLGRLGWNWVDIGGRAGVGARSAPDREIAAIAVIARDGKQRTYH
jgi:hypothetical protein